MKRIPALLLALLVFSAALAASPSRGWAQQKDRVYTYALRVTPGNQSTQVNNLVQKIVNLIFKQMGEKVQFVTIPDKDVLKFVTAKKADFIYLDHTMYVDLQSRGIELHPMNTIGTRGHLKDYRCIGVAKNSTYKAAADLKGKTFATPWAFGDFVALRTYLADSGLGEPDKYFGEFIGTADETESLVRVAEGKIDATYVPMMTYDFLKFANPTLSKKIRMIDCSDLPWPTGPVVMIGKLDPVFMKKFYGVLSQIETVPEFKQLMPILNIVRNQLYLVSDKDYDGIKKIFAQAKKSGQVAAFEKLKKK